MCVFHSPLSITHSGIAIANISPLHAFVAAGIGKSTQTRREMNEEDYVVWERKFRGLCKQSEYYVGRPARKQVEIEKQVTTYQFQPEKIKVKAPPQQSRCAC